MKKNIVAVIPAKSNSTRVPNKNFRDFYKGQSLLEIKIKQCLESGVFDTVYVSSDTEQAKEIAEKFGAEFVLRDRRLCLDETPWSEVLVGVLDSLQEDENTLIAWAPLTSPMFDRFSDAFDKIKASEEFDSVMTITKLQHYFLNSDHIPMNFQYGVWASYSQSLKPVYQMNCALWLAKKGAMIRNRFQLGDRPFYMETSQSEGVDIDTMDEFEIAQLLYARKYGNLAL